MILKVIESRSERFGEIVSGLLGMAWSITTYFVVPVVVVESAGPGSAFKRSASFMRKTWGGSLSANMGIGFITFLASLPGIALVVGGAYAIGTVGAALGIALVALGIVWVMIVSLVSTTLDSIVLAALYLYAAPRTVPPYFDRGMLEASFRRR